MNKQEVDFIIKLIDLYTVEKEYNRDCFSKQITEENIIKLKEDIKNMFQE